MRLALSSGLVISLWLSPGFETMPQAPRSMIPVSTPVIGGVKMQRHSLDIEHRRLTGLLRRLGARLVQQIEALPPAALPSEEWLNHAKFYGLNTLGLLKEQRERARIMVSPGAKQITDEQYQRELEQALDERIRNMPRETILEMTSDPVPVGESK